MVLRERQTAGETGRRRSRRAAGAIAAMMVAVASVGAGAGVANAQDGYERGPDPTESSIEALRGPFDTDTDSVSSFVSGFGGGTIYYPTDTSEGTFGAVAVAPGFTAGQSTMSWLGHRLASQGFVVFTIDTNSRFDQPDSRGDQLLAALDYLTQRSDVRSRIDSSRLAVMGHSMGGGGTLAAADERKNLQAAIPLTGWHTDKTWGGVQTPTLVVGAENDSVASVRSHSIPFYNSLPGSLDKAYLELDGASHFAPNSNNTLIAKYSISWLKTFVDNDERYLQFLCPAPDDRGLSDYRETCPYTP